MFRARIASRTISPPVPASFRHIRRGLQGLFLCLLALCACGKQGEGERCDINNGNEDCEAGLTCQSLDSGFSLCCPGNTGQRTVDACLNEPALPPDPDPPPALDAGDPPPPDGGESAD